MRIIIAMRRILHAIRIECLNLHTTHQHCRHPTLSPQCVSREAILPHVKQTIQFTLVNAFVE